MTISAIKAALAAGPTPGPWETRVEKHRPDVLLHVAGPSTVVSGMDGICSPHRMNDRSFVEDRANMRFIAACDPTTIAALIAEYEQLQTMFEKQGVGCLRTLIATRDELETANQRIAELEAALNPHQEGEMESSETPPPSTHLQLTGEQQQAIQAVADRMGSTPASVLKRAVGSYCAKFGGEDPVADPDLTNVVSIATTEGQP